MSTIEKLQSWYKRQCDGEWEHQYGVSIGNTDNPGWYLKVDTNKTRLNLVEFPEIRRNRSEDDWIWIRKNGQIFEAFGGTENLDEILNIFLDFFPE